MKRLVWLSVLPTLVLAACAGGRKGQTCTWQPSDVSVRLDPQDRAQRLHLMNEALVAEDLAIRFADTNRGHRSGHFAGNDTYREAREQCMSMLFEAVSTHHAVSIEEVRGALSYRSASVDTLVLVVFATFYVAVASLIVRWMFRSVPSDAPWLRALVTTIAACGAGAGGVVSFGLFAGAVEMFRIGNTHLSYRAGRDPWHQHQAALFAGFVILFTLVAVAVYQHVRDGDDYGESDVIRSGPAV